MVGLHKSDSKKAPLVFGVTDSSMFDFDGKQQVLGGKWRRRHVMHPLSLTIQQQLLPFTLPGRHTQTVSDFGHAITEAVMVCGKRVKQRVMHISSTVYHHLAWKIDRWPHVTGPHEKSWHLPPVKRPWSTAPIFPTPVTPWSKPPFLLSAIFSKKIASVRVIWLLTNITDKYYKRNK